MDNSIDQQMEHFNNILKRGDPLQRWQTVYLLENMVEAQTVVLLIFALADRNTTVRRSAALALALKKDKRASTPLIASLKDKDVDVRWCVIHALSRCGDEQALPALEQIQANDKSINHINMGLGESAKFAIALIKQRSQTEM